MGKKKIVVDSNILVSAFGWEGNPRLLLRKIINKEFEWFISLKQLAELERVMNYPRFEFTYDQKKRFLEIIVNTANIIDTSIQLDVVKDDPDDNAILECAVESSADVIISSDEHLLNFGEFRTIKIIKVSDFLQIHEG